MSKETKYDIDKIEWQQFEELSFKCLQEDIAPSIEFIEGGSDKGRDFLFKGITGFFGEDKQEHNYIFQAKHKSTSDGFYNLKGDFKDELEKVFVTNSLIYDTYCLVTNLTITGKQNDELNKIFDSFILENKIVFDVRFRLYSYRHFESCIDKHNFIKWIFPTIIKNTDFQVLLEDIFEKNQRNITKGWLAVFERNKKNFIYTSVFGRALKKLKDNNVLLLSGPSKSGKTFNAEMILFNKFCKNAFTPFKIDRIEEFDNFYDPEKKQIFLFDDAFGKYNIDLYRADSFNRKLEYIFELIDDNHKCVFTSRENIFKAFIDYSESEVRSYISKINIEVSELTNGEKDSIFRRYYRLVSDYTISVSDIELKRIIDHKNFSPETIRAYFANCSSFDLKDFKKHLDLPDEYLEKDFINLSEEKKVVLLSTLLALKGNHTSISYSFMNISSDLKKQFLISLRDELLQLEGSLLINIENIYQFYHPSMFEFFIRFISKDISSYRKLLLNNFNIGLLNVVRFKSLENENTIEINSNDIVFIANGFKRLIHNPEISLVDINAIFSWFSSPDVQLNFKILMKEKYIPFYKQVNLAIMSINLSLFINEGIYNLSDFFKNILTHNSDLKLDLNVIKKIITTYKDKDNYWLLVFRVIPLLEKEFIFENIKRNWFKGFFNELRLEIDSLGGELYGEAFPKFEQVELYKRLCEEKRHEEASALNKRQRTDYKQDTNREWYPRYIKCKEKMNVVKASPHYGYKIFEALSTNFSHIQILEENQMNRYRFNRKNKWW